MVSIATMKAIVPRYGNVRISPLMGSGFASGGMEDDMFADLFPSKYVYPPAWAKKR